MKGRRTNTANLYAISARLYQGDETLVISARESQGPIISARVYQRADGRNRLLNASNSPPLLVLSSPTFPVAFEHHIFPAFEHYFFPHVTPDHQRTFAIYLDEVLLCFTSRSAWLFDSRGSTLGKSHVSRLLCAILIAISNSTSGVRCFSRC